LRDTLAATRRFFKRFFLDQMALALTPSLGKAWSSGVHLVVFDHTDNQLQAAIVMLPGKLTTEEVVDLELGVWVNGTPTLTGILHYDPKTTCVGIVLSARETRVYWTTPWRDGAFDFSRSVVSRSPRTFPASDVPPNPLNCAHLFRAYPVRHVSVPFENDGELIVEYANAINRNSSVSVPLFPSTVPCNELPC